MLRLTGFRLVTYDSLIRREQDREPPEGDGRARGSRGRTYETTKELLSQGLSIGEIAQQRGLAETTIVGHLERVSQQGETLDLGHILPVPLKGFRKSRRRSDIAEPRFSGPYGST